MKISQLSAECHVSIDTIQYYTKLGLLLPSQKGGIHDFTTREVNDLKFIQRLKSMKFSLKEIRHIMQFKRISSANDPEARCDYLCMLQQHGKKLDDDIVKLQTSRQLLREEIRAAEVQKETVRKLGVPVEALQYLVCPNCGMPLRLEEADVTYPYIFGGKLSCACGYHAEIVDGVVDTGNRYTGGYDSPNLQRELYKGLPDDFYKYFHKSADKFVSRINQMDLNGKLVMETHINGFFFLYNHFKYLKNDCIYVITDKYMETVLMFKRLIERLGFDLKILFIADATMEFPLKEQSVRLLVSFFGDGEHQLYFQNPLVVDTARFLAPDAEVLGTSLIYGKNSRSFRTLRKKYPEGSAMSFQEDLTKDYYRRLGYTLHWETLGTLDKTPDRFTFACHMEGEPLSIAFYHAAKRN